MKLLKLKNSGIYTLNLLSFLKKLIVFLFSSFPIYTTLEFTEGRHNQILYFAFIEHSHPTFFYVSINKRHSSFHTEYLLKEDMNSNFTKIIGKRHEQ